MKAPYFIYLIKTILFEYETKVEDSQNYFYYYVIPDMKERDLILKFKKISNLQKFLQ